ncbi:response regulator transcription factor [Paenibacillus nasutitermitis]|uniref:DNA-binding response regulator n=1 Tax=Paenibacillus nasutitermitis TaxID=1652958 RepID=A0A916ZKB0_9BACL|nr:response regulator [Paenibacillus nasutitermitis]GGE02165.1 hypothetical protein GCM10010911_71510 [Paenibacillus nasutitermitis]
MYRLLIVDDEELIVNTLSGFLSTQFEELEIHRTYSAYEAIDIMRRVRFDIIISDISMPAMDGMELLEFIKSYWPDCRVIIVTAYNEFEYAYNALKYDNVNFILKVEGYEVIRDTIEQHLRQMEDNQKKEQFFLNLGNRISRMTPYLRSDMLNRILSGDRTLVQSDLDLLNIPLVIDDSVFITVGLLSDLNAAEVKKRLSEISEYVEKRIVLRKISVVFHIFENYAVWFFQKTKDIESQPFEDLANYIHESFSEIPDVLMKQTGETLSLITGHTFLDWTEVPHSFQHSIVHLERMRGDSGVYLLDLSDSAQLHIDERSYPGIEELNHLWNALKNDSKDSFLNLLRTKLVFMNKINDIHLVLPLAAVSAMEWLILEAVRYYDLDQKQYVVDFTKRSNEKKMSGAAWLNRCLELITEIFDHRFLMKEKRYSTLITSVNDYIEQHFTDDLSLTQLAELKHYNPSYLSRIYKEQTGKGLMDYINELRISEAKKLLRETEYKISEVSKRIGYNSSKYFNQVFKKFVGISATSYREGKTE